MRSLLATLILAALSALATAKSEVTNPFELGAKIASLPEGSPLRTYYEGLRSAVFRESAEAEKSFGLFLATPGIDKEYRQLALQHLGGVYMRDGRHEEAARVLGQCLEESKAELSEDDKRSALQVLSISKALAKAPKVEVVRAAETKLPIRHDKMGLARVPAEVNGDKVEVLWDTGANLCTVSEAFAKRCGFKPVEGLVEVAASTGKPVAGRIGVLEKLMLGNCELRNVSCLILPDEMLTFPKQDYSIDAVLGFPVIERLGFIRFESRDSVVFGLPRPKMESSPNLALIGYTPYVEVEYKGKKLPFLLDSGARSSGLEVRFVEAFPELEKEGKEEVGTIGGAGGSIQVKTLILPKLALNVGGRAIELKELKVTMTELAGSPIQSGVIGSDLLFAGHGYELDLVSMRFRLLP